MEFLNQEEINQLNDDLKLNSDGTYDILSDEMINILFDEVEDDDLFDLEHNINNDCSPELQIAINKLDETLNPKTFPDIIEEFDFDSLIQLTQASGKELRLRIHAEQNEICPLLKIKIPVEDTALDHKHKRKQDPCGPNGDGLVRGVISFRANSLEGKIANAWKRQFGFDTNKHPVPLPEFLRNLADYLDNPPVEQIYVHPTEKVKRPKLQASKFNTVKRYWKYLYPRRKMPSFPKSGKVTEEFKLYMEQADGFDKSVKNGSIKKLGLRDKRKIEKYLLENKKVKAPVFMGTFITEDIEKLLSIINKVN